MQCTYLLKVEGMKIQSSTRRKPRSFMTKKLVARKDFKVGQKVLLYKSKLGHMSGKLRSTCALMEQWRSRKNPQKGLLKLMGIVFRYLMKIKICWIRRWMGWTWLLPQTFHLEEVSTLNTFSLHFIHIEYIEDNAWIQCGGVGRFPPFLILFSICFVFPFLILFSVCFY